MVNFKFGLIIFAIFLLALNGCAAALIGAGAVGGIAISKDEVSTFIDSDIVSVWSMAYDVLKEMGSIVETDRKAGTIKAMANDSKIICIIDEVTKKTVKLRVRARKNLLPNIDLAYSIVTKISKLKK